MATPYIKKSNGTDLGAGDILVNQIVTVVYNAAQTRFELVPSAPTVARGIQVVTTNSLTIPNLVNTVNPNWTGFTWRSDNGYWTSGNAISIPTGLGGKYFVRATVQYPPITVSCVISIDLSVNGVSSQIQNEQHYIPISSGANTTHTVSTVLNLLAGDVLTFRTLQSSGGSVTTVANGTSLQAVLLGT